MKNGQSMERVTSAVACWIALVPLASQSQTSPPLRRQAAQRLVDTWDDGRVVGCSGMFFYPGRVGWSGFVFTTDIFGTAARAFWLVAN